MWAEEVYNPVWLGLFKTEDTTLGFFFFFFTLGS